MKLPRISSEMVARLPDQTSEWLNRLNANVEDVQEQVYKLGSLPVSFDLPIASQTQLGAVMVGAGLAISSAGVLSVSGGWPPSYTILTDKPQINSITLTGNKSLSDLGIDIPSSYWGQAPQGGTVSGTITLTDGGKNATLATTGHNSSRAGISISNGSNYIEAGVTDTSVVSNTGNVNIKPKSGSDVDVFGAKIIRVGTPTSGTDATNKDYVDTGLSGKQDTLTAGSNIQINGVTISATDTTYSNFVGTDGNTAGAAGLVPAPATTDAGKYLKADGTWDSVSTGPTVVQTTGNSTTDVMSQNAVTSMVYADVTNLQKPRIGYNASASGSWAVAIGRFAIASGNASVAIGGASSNGSANKATASGDRGIAIGIGAHSTSNFSLAVGAYSTAGGGIGSVALGPYSSTSAIGEVNIGSSTTSYGYNSSNYRLLSGLYDPQTAHDAATKGYTDSVALGTDETLTIATSDWTALAASSPYDYSATATAVTTIGASSTVKLVNDQPVLFGTHGFAIASVSGQVLTIYSIGQPTASVTLTINVRG